MITCSPRSALVGAGVILISGGTINEKGAGVGDDVTVLDGDIVGVDVLDGDGDAVAVLEGDGDAVAVLEGDGDAVAVLEGDGVLDGAGVPVEAAFHMMGPHDDGGSDHCINDNPQEPTGALTPHGS